MQRTRAWSVFSALLLGAAWGHRIYSDLSENKFAGQLFNGSIDIVGDVHGEIGALTTLLDLLGYDGNGFHPDGRKLVFLGDLVDRGPDSPGVVRLVKHFMSQGNAQCILGNHEVNHLLGFQTHGNKWAWGQTEVMSRDKQPKGAKGFQVLADAGFQTEMLEFFNSLPLVLMREDLLLVHAAWYPEAFEMLKDAPAGLKDAFESFRSQIEITLHEKGLDAGDMHEKDAQGLTKEIRKQLLLQNNNPVLVLTSGKEEFTTTPYFASGAWRYVNRVPWWERYNGCQDDKFIVFGHYWRKFMTEIGNFVAVAHPLDQQHPRGFEPNGPDKFHNLSPLALLGKKQNLMCIDYSVGARFEERGMGLPEGALGTQLAALRWPEMSLHLSDARVLHIDRQPVAEGM